MGIIKTPEADRQPNDEKILTTLLKSEMAAYHDKTLEGYETELKATQEQIAAIKERSVGHSLSPSIRPLFEDFKEMRSIVGDIENDMRYVDVRWDDRTPVHKLSAADYSALTDLCVGLGGLGRNSKEWGQHHSEVMASFNTYLHEKYLDRYKFVDGEGRVKEPVEPETLAAFKRISHHMEKLSFFTMDDTTQGMQRRGTISSLVGDGSYIERLLGEGRSPEAFSEFSQILIGSNLHLRTETGISSLLDLRKHPAYIDHPMGKGGEDLIVDHLNLPELEKKAENIELKIKGMKDPREFAASFKESSPNLFGLMSQHQAGHSVDELFVAESLLNEHTRQNIGKTTAPDVRAQDSAFFDSVPSNRRSYADLKTGLGGIAAKATPAVVFDKLNNSLGVASVAVPFADAVVKGDVRQAAEVAGSAAFLHVSMKGIAKIFGTRVVPVAGQLVGFGFGVKDTYDAIQNGNTARAIVSGTETTLYGVAATTGAFAALNIWNPAGWGAGAISVGAGAGAVAITAGKAVYDNWQTVKGWFGSNEKEEPVSAPAPQSAEAGLEGYTSRRSNMNALRAGPENAEKAGDPVLSDKPELDSAAEQRQAPRLRPLASAFNM